LLSNLEEANRKVAQLEHTLKASKTDIKELNRKLEDAIAKTADF
jgi:septal ring factor EnvC (AmiA/AmiB activator)